MTFEEYLIEQNQRAKNDLDTVKTENYTKGYAEGYPIGVNDGKEQGIEQGRTDEWNKLWDNLQKYGTRRHYVNAFSYSGWNDKNYNPKYPIAPNNAEGVANIFYQNPDVTDTKVSITAYGSARLAFYSCTNLKRIPKFIFNNTTNLDRTFYGCSALEELYCEGELAINGLDLSSCKELTHDSLMSVINCLAPTSTAMSVTLGTTNLAKLTNEEKAIATEKGWSLV